jgi:hypothetical protein
MMDDAEHDRPPQEDETMGDNEPQEESPPPRLMITKMVSTYTTREKKKTLVFESTLHTMLFLVVFRLSSFSPPYLLIN